MRAAGSENCALLAPQQMPRSGDCQGGYPGAFIAGAAATHQQLQQPQQHQQQDSCMYGPSAMRRRPGPRASSEVQPAKRPIQQTALCDITNTGRQGTSNPGLPLTDPLKAAPAPAAATSGSFQKAPACIIGDTTYSQATTSTRGSASSTCNASMDLDEDAVMEQDDPQTVAEYAGDIYRNLGRGEASHLPRPDYMSGQPDINAQMRAILVDWLVEVHMKYKLKPETLFLTVNLIDRFLEVKQLARNRLQLCGVTATLIAAKFEEIYPPEVRDFVYITDNAYTKEDILDMEVLMLTKLQFVLCCPTVAPFLERYARINNCTEAHRHLMQYMLELCLPEIKMIKYPPSHLVAAATLLSNKLLKQHPAWPPTMVMQTGQTESMVKGCAREICRLLEAASLEGNTLQAVRRKFSSSKFSRVARQAF